MKRRDPTLSATHKGVGDSERAHAADQRSWQLMARHMRVRFGSTAHPPHTGERPHRHRPPCCRGETYPTDGGFGARRCSRPAQLAADRREYAFQDRINGRSLSTGERLHRNQHPSCRGVSSSNRRGNQRGPTGVGGRLAGPSRTRPERDRLPLAGSPTAPLLLRTPGAGVLLESRPDGRIGPFGLYRLP